MEVVKQGFSFKPSFIPRLVIRVSILITLYIPFSYWALNADILGKYDLGWAIYFGFTLFFALYGSAAIAFVSLILAVIYHVIDKKGDELFLYAFFISIAPIVYLIFHDYIK